MAEPSEELLSMELRPKYRKNLTRFPYYSFLSSSLIIIPSYTHLSLTFESNKIIIIDLILPRSLLICSRALISVVSSFFVITISLFHSKFSCEFERHWFINHYKKITTLNLVYNCVDFIFKKCPFILKL